MDSVSTHSVHFSPLIFSLWPHKVSGCQLLSLEEPKAHRGHMTPPRPQDWDLGLEAKSTAVQLCCTGHRGVGSTGLPRSSCSP